MIWCRVPAPVMLVPLKVWMLATVSPVRVRVWVRDAEVLFIVKADDAEMRLSLLPPTAEKLRVSPPPVPEIWVAPV